MSSKLLAVAAHLVHRHVVLPDVDPVRADFLHQPHSVVKYQPRTETPAELRQLPSDSEKLLVGGILHAQLHPFAAAPEHSLGPRQFVVASSLVRNELQHNQMYLFISAITFESPSAELSFHT